MKTEDKLRSAMRDYTESIRPDPRAWQEIQRRMAARPGRSWRPAVTGFIAATAVAALIAIRLLGDGTGRVELLEPAPNPTATDQAVEPLEEPIRTTGSVDGDEAWYISFPNAWSITPQVETGSAVESWNIRNFGTDGEGVQTHPDGPEATIVIVFEVGPFTQPVLGSDGTVRPPADSVDDLFEGICRDHAPYPSEYHVVSCVETTINGRTWVREVVDAPDERRISFTTYANSKGYILRATLPGVSRYDERTYSVYQVANTVLIEEPSD